MGSNTVQAQAAGTGMDHLPSDGPEGFMLIYALTLLYSRIVNNVVIRGVCCAERGERCRDNLRLIIRRVALGLLRTRDGNY